METQETSLINFNELQNSLASALDPQKAASQTKEIFANLLLGFGVPFFAERLKNKLPEDAYNKIMDLLKDPDNLGKNSLEFAKQVFKDKFLEPIKNQMLEQLSDQVPELKGIDLTTASLKDIQDTITKSVITKMKAKLPPEIADNLPENFTQEDILNAVKRLGTDKALEFAKNNLPPDAYAELERNQDILTDPAKISDFVKGKLGDLQNQVETNFKAVQSQVQGRIDEVKTAIKGKIDEATAEVRGKLDQLNKARDDAKSAWNDAKGQFRDKLNQAQSKLDEFKANNPNSAAEDLQPFEKDVADIKNAARAARDNFLQGDTDFATQIEETQGKVAEITNNLVSKVANIKANITGKVAELQQKAQETQQSVQRTIQGQPERPAPQPQQRSGVEPEGQPERPPAPSENRPAFRASEGEGEQELGLFDRMKAFATKKVSQLREALTSNNKTQQVVEDGEGNIQVEPRYTMLQADEPLSNFSEHALSGRLTNPVLQNYFGSELTSPDQLLDAGVKARINPYRSLARQPKTKPKPAQRQVEEEPSTEPQFSPEELRAAEQARLAGETGARQRVLPTQPNAQQSQEPANTPPQATEQERVQQAEAEGEQAPQPTTAEQPPRAQPQQLAQQGEAPVAQQQPAPTTKPAPKTAEPAGEMEGDDIGKMLGSSALEDVEEGTSTAAAAGAAAGGEATEGILAGLVGGLSEVPVVGVLVDIAGIIGSIFGAKALMKQSTPATPLVSGSTYEPNL